MSMKQDQASAKMAEECQEKEYLIPFEEYLTSICTDRVAEKILADGKTLQGCYNHLIAEAEKKLKTKNRNQCIVMRGEEGIEIIQKYFGITEEDLDTKEPSGVIDIMSFL